MGEASSEYDAVAVRWLDACRRDEAEDGDELVPLKATTVGYLVGEGSDDEHGAWVAVAHEVFDNGTWRDVTTIPLPIVLELITLREADESADVGGHEFEHTDVEVPYSETVDGEKVQCVCWRCETHRKIGNQELLEGRELEFARKRGWLPADPERVAVN
jgi:hypothetical protein